MNKVKYLIDGDVRRCFDAAIVLGGENPREAMVEAAIQTISTDVILSIGGVAMHLAAWMDPEQWEEDWLAAGVENVDALVEGEVEEE